MDREPVEAESDEEWVPRGFVRRPLTPPPADEAWTPMPAGANGPVSGAPAAPSRRAGGIDLNTVPYETLRASGFSITQANRYLAQRERLGGFRGVADVERLTGFPRELMDWLRRHGEVRR